tara:strand:- start:3390 stop:4598 length:1209 start_codon:yes stop_codon:yes gene_type:complete
LFILLSISFLLPAHTGHAKPDKELVFGMSAAFTGANGEMGIEFYRGFMAYFDHVNANGGVHGRTIRVVPANDGYNPAPCFQNTLQFIKDDVFALFSYVGTPTTNHILPLLQRFVDDDVFLLFPLTGAQPHRTPPFGQFVYNLRASYFDETAGLVDNLVSVGRKRIAVFYQNDAYGRTGWDGVRRALRRHGLNIVSEAAYKRGESFSHDFSWEARLLMEKDPDAIICIGTYASQGALIRDLRDLGETIPVAGLSFANSDKMLELLHEAGRKNGRDYTSKLINSQVVPCYEDTSLPGVRLYRSLMDNYKGWSGDDDQYVPRRFSYVSFEGYLNGVVLVEMLRRMGDNPTPARIPEVIESISNFDLGIGYPVDFSKGRQGLDTVFYTTVIDGVFRPITDWTRWRK